MTKKKKTLHCTSYVAATQLFVGNIKGKTNQINKKNKCKIFKILKRKLYRIVR